MLTEAELIRAPHDFVTEEFDGERRRRAEPVGKLAPSGSFRMPRCGRVNIASDF